MDARTVTPDGERVRCLRREKGWSQKSLAANAKVSKRTIENIERGKPVFLDTLSQIANVLGVDPNVLWSSNAERILNIPHSRNLNFTGREDLLNDLCCSFETGKGTAVVLVLHGLGGVGKTQLAVEYAYRYADNYRLVWWVRSEEPATLVVDYAALAQEVNLPEKNDREQRVIVQGARRWLQRNTDWLLIFDNATAPDQVRDYIPHGRSGHILITSRNPDWGALGKPLCVDVLQRIESITFLCKRTGRADNASANDLAQELGDLPLALEHAAAYINQTCTAFTDYLNLFQSRPNDLWKREFPPLGYPHTIATTWRLAMQQIRKESSTAADLLVLSAFLAPNDIPRALFSRGAKYLPVSLSTLADPLAMNDTIAILLRYSLVRATRETLSVHRLVQAVVRDSLEEEVRCKWSKDALHFVKGCFSFQTDDERTWPESLRLLPHGLATLDHAEKLGVAEASDKFPFRLCLAVMRDMEGKHRNAVDICREILDETTPSDTETYAIACIELATFYDHLDQQNQALNVLDGLLNQENAETQYKDKYWWALFQKGTNLIGLIKYDEAEKELNKVWNHAPRKAHRIAAGHQLGVIDLKRHHYDQAERKFLECLRERESKESDDRRMAYEYRRLGQVYAETHRLDEAKGAFKRAIDISRKHHFQRYIKEIERDMRRYRLGRHT